MRNKKLMPKIYVNGIDADYPPFAYIDEKGNPAGFDVECLNWIAQEMGFEVKHQPIVWNEVVIISSLLDKKIDMAYSAYSITPEKLKKVDFTIPYWEINQALCVDKDSTLNIIAALSGSKYTVGIQKGLPVAKWIEKNLVKTGILPKDNLKLYESFSLAVKDLLNGKIDSVMMDDVIVKNVIKKEEAVKIVGIIKTGKKYGIAVRKEDKELKILLNEGITKLKKSAKWGELIIKYFSE